MDSRHSLMLNFLFLGAGLLFLLLEKWRPQRKVDRFREIKMDVIAFMVLTACGPILSMPLQIFYETNFRNLFPALLEFNPVIRVLLATLATDFFNYWVHYWMHKSNYFWRTHVFHPRIQELYWFSGLRASFSPYLSFILTRITVGILIFELNSIELLLYFSIGVVTNFYQHTNAKVGEGFLELILVSGTKCLALIKTLQEKLKITSLVLGQISP